MAKTVSRLLEALFPKRCPFCGAVIPFERMLCSACEYSLPKIRPPVCGRCGRELALCECKGQSFAFSGCAAPFYYEGEVCNALRQFKFCGKRHFSSIFAEYIAEEVKSRFKDISFDLCCAVPLSDKSLSLRGYNQSELLAQDAAERLSIPFNKNAVIKCRETPMQHLLPREQRLENPKGAYIADSRLVWGKTVLLIDDIMTTGSTLSSCADAILQSGGKHIYCAVLALTTRIDSL